MKKIYPTYSKIFKCIASDCPDTCCALWEVVIDSEFQKLYKSHPSHAAKKATQAMYIDKDNDVCLRLNNSRCPMLNCDNLCEIYIEMGKDALCDVCKTFPRYNKPVENVMLSGISLSCPEAARLILCDDTFGCLNDNPDFKDENAKFILKIYNLFRNFVIKESFFDKIKLAQDIQDDIDFGDINFLNKYFSSYKNSATSHPSAKEILHTVKSFSKLEFLTDKWMFLLNELCNHLTYALKDSDYLNTRNEIFKKMYVSKEIKNITIYFLYKYLAEALEYTDVFNMYKLSLICSFVICELYTMEIIKNKTISIDTKIEIAQTFSKEFEHSEDNLRFLIDINME